MDIDEPNRVDAAHSGLSLLEDEVLSMLFHLDLDGVSNDDLAADTMGLAYRHPKDWFTPFRTEDIGAA